MTYNNSGYGQNYSNQGWSEFQKWESPGYDFSTPYGQNIDSGGGNYATGFSPRGRIRGRGGYYRGGRGQKRKSTDNVSSKPSTKDDFSSSSLANKKIGPLNCGLCEVELTSPIQAKMHYEGSRHRSAVETWNKDHPEDQIDLDASQNAWKAAPGAEQLTKTIEATVSAAKKMKPTPALDAATTEEQPKPIKADPKNTSIVSARPDLSAVEGLEKNKYCNLCQCPFTSKIQAEMHYSGKNHQKKVRLAEQGGPPTSNKSGLGSQQLFCETCQVYSSSKEQMDIHVAGRKHQSKVQQLERLSRGEVLVRTQQGGFRWTTVEEAEAEKSNYGRGVYGRGGRGYGGGGRGNFYERGGRGSGFTTRGGGGYYGGGGGFRQYQQSYQRGGSGGGGFAPQMNPPSSSYYCPTCNTFSTTDAQFQAHLNNKQHKKLIAAKGGQ